MVKRAYKKMCFSAIKWILMISAVYCVAVSLTMKSARQKREEKMRKAAKDWLNETKHAQEADVPAQSQQDVHKESHAVLDEIVDSKSQKRIDAKPRDDAVADADLTYTKQGLQSKELCPNIGFPGKLLSEDTWQPVDTSKSMYTYSAYYTKANNKVNVIGIRPVDNITVICQLWGGEKGSMLELIDEREAKVELKDYRGYKYTPTVFECAVNSPNPPSHVSLVIKKCKKPLNVLKIQIATKVKPYKRRLTVCLAPFVSNYDKTAEFVNWVEINKLLGVEKIVVYDYLTGNNIARFLDHYRAEGLIEVVPWHPPLVLNSSPPDKRPTEIANYGETVALNDCLFKSKRDSEFVSTIGVNEFIIPPNVANETSVIDIVEQLDSSIAAYYVSMAFIEEIKSKPSQKVKNTEKEEIKTTVHVGFMGNRISKLLIRTSDVDFTLPRQAPNVKTFKVPPEQLVMHIHPGTGIHQVLGPVIDKALPKQFIQKVKKNFQTVWSKVKGQKSN